MLSKMPMSMPRQCPKQFENQTSTRPRKWVNSTFPNNRLLASATLDRLRHNAYCMVLDGASYRAPRTMAGSVKPTTAKAAK